MTFALADCNNFYVSCERAFNPALRRRPVVVLSSNDGCVISRSQEAKDIGITMGLPLFKAQALIRRHRVAVLSSNYALYGSMSRRVMDVMLTFPVQREVYSIDEAFLQLPDQSPEQLTRLCSDMRARILAWTGIPVSIGIGQTKTIAKMANRLVKLSGTESGVVNLQDAFEMQTAMEHFPAADVWGVGRNIRKALEKRGIITAAQLRDADTFWLRKEFGIKGLALALELQGQVCYQLQQKPVERREIVVSRTFGQRLRGFDQIAPAFTEFARRGAERLAAAGMQASSVTAFVGTDPFQSDAPMGSSVELIFETATADADWLVHFAHEALRKIIAPAVEYKKGGIVFGNLTPAHVVQDTLFNAAAEAAGSSGSEPPGYKARAASDALAAVNARYSRDSIQKGVSETPLWEQRREHMSPRYTTRWDELPIAR
jgi:DNA polymerase V